MKSPHPSPGINHQQTVWGMLIYLENKRTPRWGGLPGPRLVTHPGPSGLREDPEGPGGAGKEPRQEVGAATSAFRTPG